MQTRKCTKCKIKKVITEFHKDSTRKDSLSCWCKACIKIQQKRYYTRHKLNIKSKCKKYRSKNKEKIKAYHLIYNIDNKEKIKAYHKTYYDKNKDILTSQQKIYYIKNAEKIKKRCKKYISQNTIKIKKYQLIYQADNKEKIKKYHETYQADNKDKIVAKGKSYYINNKEKKKDYQAKNADKIKIHKQLYNAKNRNKINIRRRQWIESNPSIKLKVTMSAAISTSLKGNKNGRHWEQLVGYTLKQLKKHLEKLFTEDMSWSNYGKWHIEHKIPISVFNFTKPEHRDFKRCWALSNLQPMWALDNFAKGAKLTKHFQPSLLI